MKWQNRHQRLSGIFAIIGGFCGEMVNKFWTVFKYRGIVCGTDISLGSYFHLRSFVF